MYVKQKKLDTIKQKFINSKIFLFRCIILLLKFGIKYSKLKRELADSEYHKLLKKDLLENRV